MLDSTVDCWIDAFETWLGSGGGTTIFPSLTLNLDIALFIQTDIGSHYFFNNQIGFIGGELKFTMIKSLSQGIAYSPYKEINPVYESWMAEMEKVNAASGVGLNKGIMTGAEWFTWMRSEIELVKTAKFGMIISLIFAFIILTCSTLNIVISILSITCIAIIILSITAIM